jgi:hypothetical protein
MLRDERDQAGSVRLGRDLRYAFGLSLCDAKDIVDACRDPRYDAKLDARLRVRSEADRSRIGSSR